MVSKIRSVTRGFFFPTWSIPAALLVLTLLSYGLRALGLGFFWDDWPYVWFFHRLGPDGIVNAFAGDRPFLSFIYISSLTVLGHSIQGWQIFGLLARWLCSLGLWWMFTQTWPRHAHKAAWAAFLFAVYPGFTQQWISVIYGQAFFLFAALFFSIGITLWLARRRHSLARGWLVAGTLAALALSAFTMFSTEYFFGLELLRPVLLWLVLCEGSEPQPERGKRAFFQRAARTAAWWGPYLGLMLVFVVWRGFIHVFPGYKMTALQDVVTESPVGTLQELSFTILEDLVESTLVAWGQALQLGGFLDDNLSAGLRLLGVMLVTGVITAVYLARLAPLPHAAARAEDEEPGRHWTAKWGVQAALVGLIAMLAAGWPFWLTRLPLRMGFPQDRFTLPLAVGACLLIAGLMDLLLKDLPRKAVVLGLAVALAAGFHLNTALSYREDWTNFRNFFWQLAWRAPSVAEDTLFLSDSMPFRYYEDDSLTGPLNWVYDPEGSSMEMKYLLYDLHVRSRSLPNLYSGESFTKDFRATQFSGSTERVLVFYYAPPGCVRVLDPAYDGDLYNLPERLQFALPVSRPQELILDQGPAAAPPEDLFGSEPKHRWCYYFEKAELARQNEDWKEIVRLSHDSIRDGFRPEDPSEYLPFIEGYLRLGLTDDAYELTRAAYEESIALRPALCAAWNRSLNTGSGGLTALGGNAAQVENLLGCSAD